MKMKIRSFCLVYVRVQPHAVLCKVYKQRRVFVLLLISLMVFGNIWVRDERDKSLRFSCMVYQTQKY